MTDVRPPTPYDPLVHISREKVSYAARLYGTNNRNATSEVTRGKQDVAHWSTLTRLAENMGCSPVEFIDTAWYEEHEGGPTWVYFVLTAGMDTTIRFKLRTFAKHMRAFLKRHRDNGIDPKDVFSLIAGQTRTEDYSVKNQILAKWISRDGGGSVLYHGLLAFLNAPRADVEGAIERMRGAMEHEWARLKKKGAGKPTVQAG